MKTLVVYFLVLLVLGVGVPASYSQEPGQQSNESLGELTARLGRESMEAYDKSPFSALSKDYFSRFVRDPELTRATDEIEIDSSWRIVMPVNASESARLMIGHLGEFMSKAMGETLQRSDAVAGQPTADRTIVISESGGGNPDVAESFTINVAPNRITLAGRDAGGARDAVVKLVEVIGLKQAPILPIGEQVYTPRLRVRLGATPWMGSYKDLVFMGYNGAFVGGGSLYGLSTSDAIPELTAKREPGSLDGLRNSVDAAKKYGLKAYSMIGLRDKFDKDDPIFTAHPELRGALTWKADGQYILCTEHPLVKQFLQESVAGVFRAAPKLDGIAIIIGGESFYHCYMRAFGVEKGHTNCARCEPLGADTVVANLCNGLAEAARTVNPDAEIVAWPYSAEHVWSSDKAQSGFIKKLKPGTAIFTEIEKDEYVDKPDGVKKHLWDYSIDMIGPGARARDQVALCKQVGIPIYMKSEPELGFEAPRLPHIPCLDRWLDRADALASCGASGAWVFPAFRSLYGSSAAESYKLVWWDPHPDKETALDQLAARIAGAKAGPHLRSAWKLVSDAIPYSPELPSYYTGPYYLGPAHPMCSDPNAKLPEVFYGRYLFLAEMSDKDGLPLRPTFVTTPTGNVAVFGKMYRHMEQLLSQAISELDAARPLVDERHRLMFDAEVSSTAWFYHTARTEANFYEACPLRDSLHALAAKAEKTRADIETATSQYKRWLAILQDEKANATEALPLVEADMRLDFYYGGDHTFPHAADMIKKKIEILEFELTDYLPQLAARCGIPTP